MTIIATLRCRKARRFRQSLTGHHRARPDTQPKPRLGHRSVSAGADPTSPCARLSRLPRRRLIRCAQIPIARRRTPRAPIPAVSSLGVLRTPAPVYAAPPSCGRHPQTLTKADIAYARLKHTSLQREGRRVLCRAVQATSPRRTTWLEGGLPPPLNRGNADLHTTSNLPDANVWRRS
jgi:hypothetical protein